MFSPVSQLVVEGGDHGFQFSPKVDVQGRAYAQEVEIGVREDFKPYSRAVPNALEVHSK